MRLRSQRGVALIHAILFICLATAAVTVATGLHLARHRGAECRYERLQALYAAESGAARAMAHLKQHSASLPAGPWKGEIGRASYRATVSPSGKSRFLIRAEGVYGGQTQRLLIECETSAGRIELVRWVRGEQGSASGAGPG